MTLFPEIERLSPHFTADPAHEKLGVLFHHSVKPFEETIAYMRHPASEVSYHALIAPDGTRCTLVRDEHIAWHAGASVFRGRTRCNDFLLGLAFAGDTYAAPLTAAQLASAHEWLAARWILRRWTPEWMTDHRQVAPGRKNDLNPFEWMRVAAMIGTLQVP
ncbi:nucleoside transporter [Nibricoccus aquaticus]|uniref:N-acetylmuramoyl-L-alanine amidase n=1 Tax=Nibricoccus aquaticus TaxID=2576891 RepID=A0A290QHX0_9BACT|nr:N-acetylmuramoyl-L-alanine amidase [Nibricoccus aquaticus]ATC63452.1 nucleoside transporter [Nibricoccus aquaticus]